MNYYTNEANYDKRKIGIELDIDFGNWGIETMTNNTGRLEIIGGRGYIRPLRPHTNLPIIKNIVVGFSYVTDVDPDGNKNSDDGIYSFGYDIEVPLLNFLMFNSYAYFDWAKIDTFGSGKAIGAVANLTLIAGIAEVSAKLERRWLGEKFIASYFDAFYEIYRYMPQENGAIVRKDRDYLANINKETKGVFGELVGHILNTFKIIGNFQRLDDEKNSGILHLAAEVPDAVPKIAAYAFYDRFGIETGSDLFKLDEQSIARVGLGYKIRPYLLFNMDYLYTFHLNEEKNEYEMQKRFSPRISFIWQF